MLNKYDCKYCDSTGKQEVHSCVDNYTQSCRICYGSGKT